MDVIFDMETGDPDDFMSLALLCGHPRVNIIAVTVTPGTPHQIGVVRYCLDRFGLDIPVGAFNIDHRKARGTPDERYVKCVSEWHYRTFGDIPPSKDASDGGDILYDEFYPDVTLITGGPLKNVGSLLDIWERTCSNRPNKLGPLVAQGGFAGEGVVPPDKQLPKFKGMVTCPTYNLNGDPKSAQKVLDSPLFASKHFVSKNVCHGVVYDREMHEQVKAVPNPHLGLQIIMEGMENYLRRHPKGKKFHDPLAVCCAINPSIGTWAEVELYRERGQWGSRLKPGSGTWIIVDYDRDKFIKTLTETGDAHA